MTITLTDQQAAGLAKVAEWYESAREGFGGDVFRWFGYAGTGKTFTAARIPEHLGLTNVVFGTYTGKAASVLRRSLTKYGVTFPVTTIHSAIYFPTTSAEARAALDAARSELEACIPAEAELVLRDDMDAADEVVKRRLELEAKLPELEANAKRLRWEFNPEGPWATADLIILDEVSMVNAKLAADIESYGVPVLVLGDPAQLPPVEGGGYYTDAEPDWLLTDIQRAALDSPVTALATRVRESNSAMLGLKPADMQPKSLRAALDADVVLVWTNKRRWSMINAIRKAKGFPMGRPVVGDVIMVLTNNKDMAVFNGQLFDVLEVEAAKNFMDEDDPAIGWNLTVRTEDGVTRELHTYAEGFLGQDEQAAAKATGLGMRGQRALATFGQAITVHKAQGSEWPHVYVVNETPGMISMTQRREGPDSAMAQGRQWLYTAVTRAQERVSISQP